MNGLRFAALLVITIALLSFLPTHSTVELAHAQIPVNREVTIPVKVIFVGIDPGTVDTSYIKWNFNLPTTTYGQVILPQPYTTGVAYKVDYSFTFANDEFKSKLTSYLESIEVRKEGPNPWFWYPVGYASGYFTTTNYHWMKYVTYDANQVEEWLFNNQNDVGGFLSDGWTLMFMYLPELPSFDFRNYGAFLKDYREFPPGGTAHYYSVQYLDSDLGYRFQYRDFMTGWGGIRRFWFNDLSAGPSFWTDWEDLPLQIILRDNQIDLNSQFGKTWFTEYLSDYIWQATWNFVTPFFVYAPEYSDEYVFNIHIFDNRTGGEKQEVAIKSTINSEKIRAAFKDLLPYSKIDVSVSFEDLSRYPVLRKIIDENYKFTDSFTFGVTGSPLQYGIVDIREAYKYLQDNIRAFEPSFQRDRSRFVVPIFAFAFSSDTLFTISYKWVIERAPDRDVKALLGISLGDVAMISLSQKQFQRGEYANPIQPEKGYGFTEVVIHEAGHMVGLAHPHQFGPVGDFVQSAMGYYTWDYVFGQSDKDALRRAHVDEVYLGVQGLLQELSRTGKRDSVSIVEGELREADSKYARMDYVAALQSALKAEQMVRAALAGATILPGGIIVEEGVGNAIYVSIGLVAGLLLGFAVAWLAFTKLRVGGRRVRRVRAAGSRRRQGSVRMSSKRS